MKWDGEGRPRILVVCTYTSVNVFLLQHRMHLILSRWGRFFGPCLLSMAALESFLSAAAGSHGISELLSLSSESEMFEIAEEPFVC